MLCVAVGFDACQGCGDCSALGFLALAPGVELSQSTDRYVTAGLIGGKKENYRLELILSATIMHTQELCNSVALLSQKLNSF